MSAQAKQPTISVIVPVHNSPAQIKACLESLGRSTYQDMEVIVVDDASTDVTPEVLTALGARTLRLEANMGPSGARNRGAEVAQGEYLLFIDADVCVRPETVAQFVTAFQNDPSVDAVFGSYDLKPAARNFLSQYRNLFHHFVHQQGHARATTFWAGCGAIKRTVFEHVGGFDPSYVRPCIEDIELGARLHKAGHHIALDKRIQVTHLKRWTLMGMLKADVRDRGIPWTELILREKNMPNDLNVGVSQRLCVVLAYALLLLFALGAWRLHGLTLLPLLGLLGLCMVDYWSNFHRIPTVCRVLLILLLLGSVGALSLYFQMWGLVALAIVLGIVLINFRFYAFFARRRHPMYAMAVVPLHVLYYIYCGLSFGLGMWLHLWRSRFGAMWAGLRAHFKHEAARAADIRR